MNKFTHPNITNLKLKKERELPNISTESNYGDVDFEDGIDDAQDHPSYKKRKNIDPNNYGDVSDT